jgi:hypothetical protein
LYSLRTKAKLNQHSVLKIRLHVHFAPLQKEFINRNEMKKIAVYIFIFLLTVLIGCKSKYAKAVDEIAENLPESKNMNAGTQNYFVDVPNGWTTKKTTYQGIDYYFLLAPKTIDDPNTNINIITEYMQKFSLEVYKEKAIEALKKAIPSASILNEGKIEANGLKGTWYSYVMEPAGTKSSLISYIFPKDGVAYIITAGTQVKDASHYRRTFDIVAKSFRFNE